MWSQIFGSNKFCPHNVKYFLFGQVVTAASKHNYAWNETDEREVSEAFLKYSHKSITTKYSKTHKIFPQSILCPRSKSASDDWLLANWFSVIICQYWSLLIICHYFSLFVIIGHYWSLLVIIFHYFSLFFIFDERFYVEWK